MDKSSTSDLKLYQIELRALYLDKN